MFESLLIGLSTSASCVATCGNVVIGIIMANRQGVGRSFALLGAFMCGRLATYAVIAAVVAVVSVGVGGIGACAMAVGQILLGLLMLLYAFGRTWRLCVGHRASRRLYALCRGRVVAVTAMAGLLSALNVCPPMLSLIGSSVGADHVVGRFVLFFIGSSVLFLPMPFIGTIRNKAAVGIIGRAVAAIVAIIFIFKGFATLFYNF